MAVRFTAEGQDYARTANLPSGSIFSVLCWFKLSTDRNAVTTVWCLDDGTNFIALKSSSDGTTFRVTDQAGAVTGTFSATVGAWYFTFVSVNSGSTNLLHGASPPTDGSGSFLNTASGATLATVATPTAFRIGRSHTSGEWLDGCVAVFKVYSAVALGSNPANQERWANFPIRTHLLHYWWPLEINSLIDYSGNGYDLSGGTGASEEDGPPLFGGVTVHHEIPVIAKSGTATTSSTATLTSTGTRAATGTATTSSTAALTATGAKSVSGSAGTAVAGTLSPAGEKGASGSGSTAVVAALAATHVAERAGTAGVGATASLTSTGIRAGVGTASLGITASFAVTGIRTNVGTGAVSVTATLVAAGAAQRAGITTTLASGVLTSVGRKDGIGASIVSVTGALSNTGGSNTVGAGSLAVSAVLNSDGAKGATGIGAIISLASLAVVGERSGTGRIIVYARLSTTSFRPKLRIGVDIPKLAVTITTRDRIV